MLESCAEFAGEGRGLVVVMHEVNATVPGRCVICNLYFI